MRILTGKVAMKNVRSYRAMALLCRQQAVFHPETSWKYLSDAERWEHLAQTEISALFDECNTTKTEVSELHPAARSNAA
jgi:hypothetical protein